MSDGPLSPVTALGGLTNLPAGTTLQTVAYVAGPTSQPVLVEFPAPVGRRAVQVDPGTADTLTVLSVPARDHETASATDSVVFTQLQQWVESAGSPSAGPPVVMTFQGVQLCWAPGRVALLAAPERLETLARAVIEVAFYDAELRSIQQAIGDSWPQLEVDTPLAFEFAEADLNQRTALRERFRQVTQLRARLTRISQQVHTPHQHPPTLASQIGERFRDRTRMESRYEFLDEQIEVFEGVYEMCGQRANDFVQARAGHILEWIIIILLVTQLLLSGFEMLASTTVTPPASATSPVSAGQGQ
jgi:hypothetical protein